MIFPQTFGPYTLLKLLAARSKSRTFLARRESSSDALYVVKRPDPEFLRDGARVLRHRHEARLLMRLRHPNIVRGVDSGQVNGEPYLAMEYVDEARPLDDILATLNRHGKRLPEGIALWIAREVAAAVEYLHGATEEGGKPLDLVLLDLGVHNVLIARDGKVKLVDLESASSALISWKAVGEGCSAYNAPEQLVSGRDIDQRADVYAAGIVLFFLLTCRSPVSQDFAVKNMRANFARRLFRNLHPLPSDVDRGLARYDAMVDRALHYLPEKRYQTMREWRQELDRALEEVAPKCSTEILAAYLREVVEPLRTQAVPDASRAGEERFTRQVTTTGAYAL